MTFRATVLTLYPEMFPGPLGASLAGRGLGDGIWSLEARNIRDHAIDKHRTRGRHAGRGRGGDGAARRRAGGGAWMPSRTAGRCWR